MKLILASFFQVPFLDGFEDSGNCLGDMTQGVVVTV